MTIFMKIKRETRILTLKKFALGDYSLVPAYQVQQKLKKKIVFYDLSKKMYIED